jgi:Flp pilus assembly protein TadG
MSVRAFRSGEAGASMAEFAIVAAIFFMLIIGIIECARLFYTHNALTDAARRGARYAVLHRQADLACVQNVVVYGEANVDPTTCAPTGPPLLPGLAPANVNVQYDGNAPNPYGMNLGTATVTIQNYDFNLSIPLFTRTIDMPAYSTTLTAESAGEIPADI